MLHTSHLKLLGFSSIIEEAFNSTLSDPSLPLFESTPLFTRVEMSGDVLDSLNQSIDLMDLDNQPKCRTDSTHENILLISDTIDSDAVDTTPKVDDSVSSNHTIQSTGNSVESFDPTRPATPPPKSSLKSKRAKSVKLPLKTVEQKSNGDIFDQSLLNGITLVKIAINNKGRPQLIIRDEDKLRCMNISGGGVSKKGFIKWECNQRICSGKLKTKLREEIKVDDYVEAVKIGSRFRFQLKDGTSLKAEHLSKIERTPHNCLEKAEARMVLNKISQECENLVAALPERPLKRPRPSEIKQMAVKTVYDQMDEEKLKNKPLKLPPTTIPRKVARMLRQKYSKLTTDINLSNKMEYEFEEDMYTGNFKLDDKLAKSTKNNSLLFYSPHLLKHLTTGDHMGISDGKGSIAKHLIPFREFDIPIICYRVRDALNLLKYFSYTTFNRHIPAVMVFHDKLRRKIQFSFFFVDDQQISKSLYGDFG